jgi:hypothetical protein
MRGWHSPILGSRYQELMQVDAHRVFHTCAQQKGGEKGSVSEISPDNKELVQ